MSNRFPGRKRTVAWCIYPGCPLSVPKSQVACARHWAGMVRNLATPKVERRKRRAIQASMNTANLTLFQPNQDDRHNVREKKEFSQKLAGIVIAHIRESGRGPELKDLAKQLDVAKGTVSKHIVMLAKSKVIDIDGKRYSPRNVRVHGDSRSASSKRKPQKTGPVSGRIARLSDDCVSLIARIRSKQGRAPSRDEYRDALHVSYETLKKLLPQLVREGKIVMPDSYKTVDLANGQSNGHTNGWHANGATNGHHAHNGLAVDGTMAKLLQKREDLMVKLAAIDALLAELQ